MDQNDHTGAISPNSQDLMAASVAIGNRIASKRAAMGLTQDELARSLRVPPNQLDRWEKGSERIPAVVLAQVANRLNAPVGWFFHTPRSTFVQFEGMDERRGDRDALKAQFEATRSNE